MRQSRHLLAILILVALTSPAQAQDDETDPLGVNKKKRGTRVTVWAPPVLRQGQKFTVRVTFTIPKGYHIYGPPAKGVENPTPTALKMEPTKGVVWGAPVYPKVHKGPFRDKTLDMVLSEYKKQVTVTIPGEVKAKAPFARLNIRVLAAWGTCNDMSCLELRTLARNPAKLSARSQVVLTSPTLTIDKKKVAPGESFTVKVAFDIPEGHHIYGPTEKYGPTKVVMAKTPGVTWSEPVFPAGKKLTGKVVVTVKGTLAKDAKPGALEVLTRLSWGTCDATACYESVDALPLFAPITVGAAE